MNEIYRISRFIYNFLCCELFDRTQLSYIHISSVYISSMKSSTKVPYDSTRDALKQRQKVNVRSDEPKIRTVDRERRTDLLHSKSVLQP